MNAGAGFGTHHGDPAPYANSGRGAVLTVGLAVRSTAGGDVALSVSGDVLQSVSGVCESAVGQAASPYRPRLVTVGVGLSLEAHDRTSRGAMYEQSNEALRAGNALRAERPVDLLWEVYAPTAREGNVRYRVSISVQREERTGLVGVVARLGGRVRNAVVRSTGTDKVAAEYDRTAAMRSQRTESIRLDLGSARAGRYLMTLEVTDLNSGATAITHRDVVLVDR